MTRAQVTCLDCGTEFVRPSGYTGNYCPDCHESWVQESDDVGTSRPEPRRLRPETTPSIRHRDDDDADLPSRYDAE
ncbi:DUF7564 family protein [Halobellus salinisoli]|uniref:DUF7564 family protein n=1 Tax=Halobellus salinisoli TaxID=3108500 RepID=UPI00300A176B